MKIENQIENLVKKNELGLLRNLLENMDTIQSKIAHRVMIFGSFEALEIFSEYFEYSDYLSCKILYSQTVASVSNSSCIVENGSNIPLMLKKFKYLLNKSINFSNNLVILLNDLIPNELQAKCYVNNNTKNRIRVIFFSNYNSLLKDAIKINKKTQPEYILPIEMSPFK